MRQSNKGFTLIELLVVMAIMAIFTGMSFATIGLIQAGNMTSVTKNIAAGMQETRQKTMTQNLAHGWSFSVNTDAEGEVSMTITKNATADKTPQTTTTVLKKCTLYYQADGATAVEVSDFTMTFDASTGAVKNINYVSGGTTYTQTSGTAVIKAEHGGKNSELTIFFATGKYEVK